MKLLQKRFNIIDDTCVLALDFNDNAGEVIDKSNAPRVNPTVTGTLIANGVDGLALDFDGVNDTVVFAANAVFNTVDFSVMMWLNPDALRVQGIIGKNDFVNAWRIFMNDTNGTLEFDAMSDASNLEFSTDIANTAWSAIAITYNKATTTATAYVNGVTAGTRGDFTDAGNDNNSNPTLAPNETNEFNGQMDRLFWFNRVLTAQEIKDEYDNYSQ